LYSDSIAPPPNYQGYTPAPNDPNIKVHYTKGDKINMLFEKYEISHLFREKLEKLQDFKIVFILDDSGSMNTPVDNGKKTRWEELKDIVEISIDIGSIYSTLDINFLNRSGIHNVTSFNQTAYLFREPELFSRKDTDGIAYNA